MADSVLGLLFEIAENPSKAEEALQGDNGKLLKKFCAQELANCAEIVNAEIAERGGDPPAYLMASTERERKVQ